MAKFRSIVCCPSAKNESCLVSEGPDLEGTILPTKNPWLWETPRVTGKIPGEVCAVYYGPQKHQSDYKKVTYLGLIFSDQKFDHTWPQPLHHAWPGLYRRCKLFCIKGSAKCTGQNLLFHVCSQDQIQQSAHTVEPCYNEVKCVSVFVPITI